MPDLTRRALLSSATLGVGAIGVSELLLSDAIAQTAAPVTAQTPAQPPRFGFDDVARRARELASTPFDPAYARLPENLEKMDFDAWRDIRFRPEKSFLNGSQFKLQLFHLGHLYRRAVTVNTIRDGIATPIPYAANLFDLGRNKLDKPLPINTGFAGFRLHFPVNDPRVQDEIASFIGASYFRILGRGQHYGISARALAVATGTNQEEFPFFREFWIETPDARSERATVYGLLDGLSVTGAFRFDIYPGQETVADVRASLYPRRNGVKLGLAPLTSMFFLGENDRRINEDFRIELHDSDGLLMNNSNGEWLWRPLRNPPSIAVSSFLDKDPKGFGLLQRDRDFSSYQDLDLNYESRPSYWIEPHENWGEGRVELVELPTTDETNDNIVASFVPLVQAETGKPINYGYKMLAALDLKKLSPNGRVINTFQTAARALGSREIPPPGSRRFLIDFAGGDLSFYLNDPALVELVPSVSAGRILRSFVIANARIDGIRAVIDVQANSGQTIDIRAFLRANGRTLTETWTFPWTAA